MLIHAIRCLEKDLSCMTLLIENGVAESVKLVTPRRDATVFCFESHTSKLMANCMRSGDCLDRERVRVAADIVVNAY